MLHGRDDSVSTLEILLKGSISITDGEDITLQAEQEKEDVFQALKKIFTEYHGEHVVYLHMAGRWQKTGPQFWLNAAPGAAEAIEELLGKGAVRQR